MIWLCWVQVHKHDLDSENHFFVYMVQMCLLFIFHQFDLRFKDNIQLVILVVPSLESSSLILKSL